MEQLTILQAVILGIVQGLTEFLPISSTAHLRIVPALAGWNDIGAEATAVMQLGTLLAVLIYFWSDLWRLACSFVIDGVHWLQRGLKGAPWKSHDAKLAWLIGAGTIPICVFGLLFKDFIKGGARSLWVQVATLIGLAVLLFVAERVASRSKELTDIGWGDGIAVGLAQAVALLPGSSRSGTTITAALFCGMTRESAARFSFLLSVPAVLLSGVYELYEIRGSLGGPGTPALVVATAVSFVVGFAAIAFLLKFLRTHTTMVFVAYRIGLGLLLAGLLIAGVLQAG
ncbi:MAG: undecaprenyl-diphosphatase UppP [Acidobacteria bacterium]|nr:undecaprenyl-diphosphatase UppP [Acidobacteriota bacterium]